MAYRDVRISIDARAAGVRAELAQVEAQLVTTGALLARRKTLRAELETLTHRRLPVLATLEIASHCEERWEAMLGDARERWCGRCGESVYDLSAFTTVEAEALLARPHAPCVRFARRADGTVTTSDCAPPRSQSAWSMFAPPLAIATGVIASGVIAVGGLVALTTPTMGRSTVNQTRSDAQAVRSAVLLYMGQEPGAACPSIEQLEAAGTIDHSRRTTDAWDRAFRIECDGDDIIIRSDGQDGIEGTGDDVQ